MSMFCGLRGRATNRVGCAGRALRHNFSAWWDSDASGAFVHWAIAIGKLCAVDGVGAYCAGEAKHIAHAASGRCGGGELPERGGLC